MSELNSETFSFILVENTLKKCNLVNYNNVTNKYLFPLMQFARASEPKDLENNHIFPLTQFARGPAIQRTQQSRR